MKERKEREEMDRVDLCFVDLKLALALDAPEDDPANEQGTPENFEKERRQNDWDDEQAREIWDRYYR